MLRLLIVLCFFAFPLNDSLHAFWTSKQVQEYAHHSELQRRSAWQLIARIPFKGNERVLDIGCRDGHNAAWISRMIPNGKVLGVDSSEAMITWAKKQYHPYEFPNLHFVAKEIDTNFDKNKLAEVFDIVTSFFSMHMVANKQAVISKINYFLKPGGLFFCVIPPLKTNAEYDKAFLDTLESEKWKSFFNNYEPAFCFCSLKEYKQLFTSIGLNILECRFQPSADPFVNDEEFVSWFKACMPHIHYIPEELQNEFIYEILDRYLTNRPSAITDDGAICFFWGRYEIIAQKKESYIEMLQ